MSQEKKLTLYEVNPRYFKDNNGDGIGDLQGLAQKFDYFTFLGVDGIILSNLLSTDSDDERQSFTTIASELGNLNDFVKVLSLAKHRNIKIFIELNIGTIKNNNNWYSALVEDGSEEFTGLIKMINKVSSLPKEQGVEYVNASINLGYYAQKEATKEIPLNWKSNTVIKQFIKVIRFWKELGVSGFVFKNFEFVAEEPSKLIIETLSTETQKELRKFYKAIKEEDENLVIIGRSDVITEEHAGELTAGSKKVVDYFMPTSISMHGTRNNSIDHIGKFTTKKLAKALNFMGLDASNIVTFGSSRVGRTVSRWGTDGQFHQEAAKLISIALLLNKASSSIYYGDEIGVKNIGLNHLDDFQDDQLEERKKQVVDSGYSEENFMTAQVLQNPINAISIFAWNNKKNGGFSNNSQTITPITSSYRYVNVEVEFADKASILNFNKNMIELIGEEEFSKIITSGTYKATSLQKGILRIRIWSSKHEIVALLNFTNKTKKVFLPPSSGKVVISTYPAKEYSEDYIVKELEAYEGVVVAKLTDEYTKEIKIRKQAAAKAREIAKREKDEMKRYEELLIQEATKEFALGSSNEDEEDKITKQAQQQKIKLKNNAKASAIQGVEKTVEIEAREVARLQKDKSNEINLSIEQTQLLNLASEKQQEKQAKEQARLEKEKTRQLALEAKQQARLEKEKTRQLELEAREKARLEKEQTRLQELKELEKTRLLEQKASDKELREKEKTRQLELEAREKERFDLEKKHELELKAQKKEQLALEKTRLLEQKQAEQARLEQEKTRQLELEAREKERIEQEKAKEQARLEKEKTRQLELEAREQARLEKEKTRQLELEAREQTRLEKEKTRQLELEALEKERIAQLEARQKEIQEKELAKQQELEVREKELIAQEKAREKARLEQEKTRQLELEAREKERLEQEKAKEQARLEKEKTRQLELEAREQARLEKEKTRQLEIEAREQARLEKEKTRQLELEAREQARVEKERTRLLEIEAREQERIAREQAREHARIAAEKAHEVARLEKEKAHNLMLLEKEKAMAAKFVEHKAADIIKPVEHKSQSANAKLEDHESESKVEGIMKKMFGIFNKKDHVSFSGESSAIDFEKAAKKAEREALKEATRLEKEKSREFARLEKERTRELARAEKEQAREVHQVSEIELEKQRQLAQQELQAKHARFHGEKTSLVDSQVAKTTQIDVNNVEDVEAYLKDLDSQKK